METVFKVVRHLAANPGHKVVMAGAKNPFDAQFKIG